MDFRILRAFDRVDTNAIKEWYLDIIKYNPMLLFYVMFINHYNVNVFTDLCYRGYRLRYHTWEEFLKNLEKNHSDNPSLRIRGYSTYFQGSTNQELDYNTIAFATSSFSTYENAITIGAPSLGLETPMEKWLCLFPTATLVKNKVYVAFKNEGDTITILNENSRKLTIKKERFVKQNE